MLVGYIGSWFHDVFPRKVAVVSVVWPGQQLLLHTDNHMVAGDTLRKMMSWLQSYDIKSKFW